MKRHAYLIMAHNNFEILKKLLESLDDSRNDIYIHIDKKVENFDFDLLRNCLNKSNIFFTDRTDVGWGDYSQINCEYILLKKAFYSENDYSYYHFLSGVDLPIKTQDDIHTFFDSIDGKEVVQLASDKLITERHAYYRISRYHFLSRYTKHKSKIIRNLIKFMNFIIMPLQSLLHIDRLKHKQIKVGYGANWVSITNEFVKYIIDSEDFIKKVFKHSLCADELFIQTLLVNSKFIDNVYSQTKSDTFDGTPAMRYIDWGRGNPYVFKIDDYNSLINSNMLFARKFDYNQDKEIVEKIYDYVKNQK